MTVENSELNKQVALRESTASLVGGSGDGNDPSLADLKRGFLSVDDPEHVPHYLPQNDDSGTNYVNPYERMERGGFLTRPEGHER